MSERNIEAVQVEGIEFIRHSDDGKFKELIAFW